MIDLTDQKEFEERADYSTPEDLNKWGHAGRIKLINLFFSHSESLMV